jgi:hypothetical protein
MYRFPQQVQAVRNRRGSAERGNRWRTGGAGLRSAVNQKRRDGLPTRMQQKQGKLNPADRSRPALKPLRPFTGGADVVRHNSGMMHS